MSTTLESHSRLRPQIVNWLLLTLISAAFLIRSWVFVYLHLISPAWFDLWNWVDDVQRWSQGSFTLHDLVKPHGEHRIVPARVILLIDAALFKMNGWFPVLCNLLFIGATGGLIGRLAKLDGTPGRYRQLPLLFWIALTSSVCQAGNLISPFQVAISSGCFLAVAAASLLGTATASVGLMAIGLAAAAGLTGVLAAFSLGGGIFLTPALLALLLLRRAAPIVWGVFTPISVLGVVLFFHHYSRDVAVIPPIFDWDLTVVRILYVGNFLASSLVYFSNTATIAGLCSLLLLLLVCLATLKKWLSGRLIPPNDATLIALGMFLIVCAAAGTLTFRLYWGAKVALVDRYSTMSLAFVAVLFGLLIRWASLATSRPWVQRAAVPIFGLAMLGAFNLPYYDRMADSLRRVANADAQLLVNDVAVQGPAPVIFLGTPDDVRSRVVFLHQQKTNMFAPENGPPAELLARLRGPGPWPACRGYVDQAYGIDDTGFLLRAWLADPQGRHGAPWLAALDDQGALLGTARPYDERPDVSGSLHMPSEAFGFADGFRLQRRRTDPGATVQVRLMGLFPGESQPVCALPMPALIGPVPIEPAVELRDLSAAPLTGAPSPGGFVAWDARRQPGEWARLPGMAVHPAMDVAPGTVPGGVAAWRVATQGHGGEVLRFRVDAAAAGSRALAVPFAVGYEWQGTRLAFLFADGTRLETALPTLFNRRDWRAAVLPPGLLARHPGPVGVEVQGAGNPWLVVGAPLLVSLRPEWSKIF